MFGARSALAKARIKRIRLLTKKHAQPKKLIRTGFKPQATWGQAARGMAPTSIKKYRANVATAQPQWRPGACTTMMLELAQHPVEDPAIELRAALFWPVVRSSTRHAKT